jgi:hypothetical protein
LEYSTIKEIQKIVKDGFVDNLPPHLHASARQKEYTPDASSIFVVDFDDFKSMTAKEVQDIFRHRHILVRNSPVETRPFDLESLEMLGSLTAKVSMQGQFRVDLHVSGIWLT